ncbi:MAG: phospho-sugar mutase [Desulfobacterales bacterium]|nr:phospho-sugar mutase [Desulfobacterales bacterium]
MATAQDLIAKAQNGFNQLDMPAPVVAEALEALETWLIDDAFEHYRPQLEHLIATQEWEFLLDAFYQVIPFGTGGRRGLVGIGPNRINPWTIQSSAQGHAQFLLKTYGEEARQRGVVLTWDVRVFTQQAPYSPDRPNPIMNLDGRQLAEAAAVVYAANGIKVYMYDAVRSTPQLSFTIRHLKAISGDMFSASHNLPTDNGKKVYDQYGGQLIPPHDQILVDEVTQQVEGIQTMPLEQARAQGLVELLGTDLDRIYQETVAKLSLSDARDIKVVFAPLHGTGLTSVYPILQNLGFDVTLDPHSANLSGAFENVTFNIPNPEVQQSFDTALPHARETAADILISTDPDADRVGVMVNHHGRWEFLNGNEIGVLLTHYGITKMKATGRLDDGGVVIKTDVTTSLVAAMAEALGVECIGDLLVGFKYIGEEMNKLDAAGRMADFVLGTEESHGFLMGNYARDKDAAGAAIWIAEHAAELKQEGRSLVDELNHIYATYGYCHNHLTEIRLLGAKGMGQIRNIMDHLREEEITAIGDFRVSRRIDRWQGAPQPHLSPTDTSSRNVLVFYLQSPEDIQRLRVTVRPSGTEPKVKMYFELMGRPCGPGDLAPSRDRIVALCDRLEKQLMQYCYGILGVDFPERGFLLFWQLPLDTKLTYFEIEEDIAALKTVDDPAERRKALDDRLQFLGANPVQKIDPAFEARYGKGVMEYLGLDG